MSLSTRIYKKNISNKKINDSSSESNFTNHKENNSTKQLQSFQNLADQYVNYQSDKNIQLQSKENKTGLPENIKSGIAKPRSKIQIMQKIKKITPRNKKFSVLYFRIISLLILMNS